MEDGFRQFKLHIYLVELCLFVAISIYHDFVSLDGELILKLLYNQTHFTFSIEPLTFMGTFVIVWFV